MVQPLSIVLNVRFTTNGMCVMNNTHVAWTSRNNMSTLWDLHCCLVPQRVKLCAHAALPFHSQQSGALTRMWRWCQVQPSQKERAIGVVIAKREDAVATSQLALHWKCGFRVLNAWKWPEMNMYLDLNLATFHYVDGFGCYHLCLNSTINLG